MRRLALLILVVLALLLAVPVLAQGLYRSEIVVTDSSGADRVGVPVLVPFNVTQAVSFGYLSSSGLDSRLFEGTTERRYMVASDKVGILVPSLLVNQERTYRFETGYSPPNTSFGFIPGTGGYVTVADVAALELGNNFTIEQKGWVDTGAGTGKNTVYKGGAFGTYISGSGNITSGIFSASSWGDVYSGGYSNNVWIEQTYSQRFVSQVRVRFSRSGLSVTRVYVKEVQVWNDDTSAWVTSGVNWSDGNTATYYDYYYDDSGLENPPVYGDFIATTIPTAKSSKLRYYLQSVSGGSSMDIDVLGSTVAKSVTATGVSSGEHTVKTTADGTNLKIYIDDVEKDSVALSGASVPDNSNNWVLMQNNVMSYLEYYKHTVGGTLIAWYQPNTIIQSGTTSQAVAFPSIESSTSNTNSSGTSHTINLPSIKDKGKLLLVTIGTSSNPTITWPTGWTQLFSAAQGTNLTLASAYKVAAGTEGSSITVTTSASVTSSCQSYTVITYQGVPVTTTAVTGAATTNPDPPSLTSGFGAVNTLWLVLAGDSVNVTAYPSLYTGVAVTGTTPYLAGAYRQLNAASEDPEVFTAASGNWVANTIAIKVADPGILVDREGAVQSGVVTWGSNSSLSVEVGGLESITSYTSTPAEEGGIPTVVELPGAIDMYPETAEITTLPYYDLFKPAAVGNTVYSTGTVTGTISTATLAGAGTNWILDYREYSIVVGSYTYTIASVTGPTSLTLTTNLQTSPSNASYIINSPSLQWSVNTLYGVMAIFVGIGIGVGVAIATGSSLLAGIAVGVGLAVGASTGAVGWWVLIVYAIFAGGYLVAARSM